MIFKFWSVRPSSQRHLLCTSAFPTELIVTLRGSRSRNNILFICRVMQDQAQSKVTTHQPHKITPRLPVHKHHHLLKLLERIPVIACKEKYLSLGGDPKMTRARKRNHQKKLLINLSNLSLLTSPPLSWNHWRSRWEERVVQKRNRVTQH